MACVYLGVAMSVATSRCPTAWRASRQSLTCASRRMAAGGRRSVKSITVGPFHRCGSHSVRPREGRRPRLSGHYLFPVVAVVQHCVGGFLGGLDGMVGSPSALYFVSGGAGVELEDVAQGGHDESLVP